MGDRRAERGNLVRGFPEISGWEYGCEEGVGKFNLY